MSSRRKATVVQLAFYFFVLSEWSFISFKTCMHLYLFRFCIFLFSLQDSLCFNSISVDVDCLVCDVCNANNAGTSTTCANYCQVKKIFFNQCFIFSMFKIVHLYHLVNVFYLCEMVGKLRKFMHSVVLEDECELDCIVSCNNNNTSNAKKMDFSNLVIFGPIAYF